MATTTTVTAANLINGPATLFTGSFGATEPADSAVASAPAASAWTDVGGTMGGSTVRVAETWVELEVDQIVDVIERRRTKREMSVTVPMAEVTMENLSLAWNGGTISSQAAYETYEPDNGQAGVSPTYKALILDGPAPGSQKQRRVIVRKVISIEGTEIAFTKDGQQVLATTFGAHYVSSVIRPFKVVDQLT